MVMQEITEYELSTLASKCRLHAIGSQGEHRSRLMAVAVAAEALRAHGVHHQEPDPTRLATELQLLEGR